MIVRRDASHYVCITQPDHAALAATLIEAWCADGLPTRPTRSQVVLATRVHDVGWELEDAAPRVDPAERRAVRLHVGADRRAAGRSGRAPWRCWRRATPTSPRWSRSMRSRSIAAISTTRHGVASFRRSSAARRSLRRGRYARPGGGVAPLSFLQDYSLVGIGDLFSLVVLQRVDRAPSHRGLSGYTPGERAHHLARSVRRRRHRLRGRGAPAPSRRYDSDADLRLGGGDRCRRPLRRGRGRRPPSAAPHEPHPRRRRRSRHRASHRPLPDERRPRTRGARQRRRCAAAALRRAPPDLRDARPHAAGPGRPGGLPGAARRPAHGGDPDHHADRARRGGRPRRRPRARRRRLRHQAVQPEGARRAGRARCCAARRAPRRPIASCGTARCRSTRTARGHRRRPTRCG